jgi:hypothetical protein
LKIRSISEILISISRKIVAIMIRIFKKDFSNFLNRIS